MSLAQFDCYSSITVPQGVRSVFVNVREGYAQWAPFMVSDNCPPSEPVGTCFETQEINVYSSGGQLLYHFFDSATASANPPPAVWPPFGANTDPRADSGIATYYRRQFTDRIDVSNLTQSGSTIVTIELRYPGLTSQPSLWTLGLNYTIYSGPSVLDPAPGLLFGNGITTDPETLARLGMPVTGIAADRAARAVFRIPAPAIGSNLTVYVVNDQGGLSSSTAADGALVSTDNQTSPGVSSLQVTAVNTSQGPMAFVIYLAPPNFSRGSPTNDDNLDQRRVSLWVVPASDPTFASSTTGLTIWRPPIVLVHGLWGSAVGWYNFTPLINDPQRKFFIETASYAAAVSVSSSVPAYSSLLILSRVRASALGFDFSAPSVLNKIVATRDDFRAAKNAAAAQADVIGHSMGGNMARTLINLLAFAPLESSTFGAGYIDKLITIGTPHLGSVLAYQMLQDNNSCVRSALALGGNVAIGAATVNGTSGIHGAMLDLEPGSDALTRMQSGSGPAVPTAPIAGTTAPSNLASLDNSASVAGLLRTICPNDYLAQSLMSSTWNNVFAGEANDAIVALSSQLAGLTGSPVNGVIHTSALAGVLGLGFTGPAELDPAASIPGIQALAILYLNESPQGPDFHPLH